MSSELTEIIGLLKKVITAPVTVVQNAVYGRDNVRKAKLAQLRAKRHALVSKLHQIRRAQKDQDASTRKSKNVLKSLDAEMGTTTHDDIFGKPKKIKEPKASKVTNKPKKRKPKQEL